MTGVDEQDCRVCEDMRLGLGTDADTRLGFLHDILAFDCPGHRPLFEWVLADITKRFPAHRSLEDVAIAKSAEGFLTLVGWVKGPGLEEWEEWNFCSIGGGPHSATARALDPNWMDVSVVKSWLETCEGHHGMKCENPLKIWPFSPTWLVDTEQRCLVPGAECGIYVALSYRWGTMTKGLNFDSSTITNLRKPGSLDSAEFAQQLAPTVLHAIGLAAAIGQRYIWLDALCIDHSNSVESTKELENMGAIYANAVLTIVAADGDAEYGIPGIRGTSQSKMDFIHETIPFGSRSLVLDLGHEVNIEGGQYHRRAWTHQEYYMARRCLIIRNNLLHWKCQRSVWEEHLLPGIETGKHWTNQNATRIMSGTPYLNDLSDTLSRYNCRRLTYDEDALPGITGLLSAFSRCFTGGFICGIPEMFFETALSWKPKWSYCDLRRRIPSDRPESARLRPHYLPSWSWVAWQGAVNLGEEEVGYVRDRDHIQETVPITTWYAISLDSSVPRRKIRNAWYDGRTRYHDVEQTIPGGWSREAAESNKSRLWPTVWDRHIYRKPSEKSHGEHWYWPFDIPEITDKTEPFMPEQTPFLQCTTRRACVLAVRRAKLRKECGKEENSTQEIELYSRPGHLIGELQLHNQEQMRDFALFQNEDWSLAKQVELVAICRKIHQNKIWSTVDGEHTQVVVVREVYSVLWVEWVDGIAYRVAGGEVDKEEWENLALEEIALVLG